VINHHGDSTSSLSATLAMLKVTYIHSFVNTDRRSIFIFIRRLCSYLMFKNADQQIVRVLETTIYILFIEPRTDNMPKQNNEFSHDQDNYTN
jgi:hypothetical protein